LPSISNAGEELKRYEVIHDPKIKHKLGFLHHGSFSFKVVHDLKKTTVSRAWLN
jgi:hypothetical protein